MVRCAVATGLRLDRDGVPPVFFHPGEGRLPSIGLDHSQGAGWVSQVADCAFRRCRRLAEPRLRLLLLYHRQWWRLHEGVHLLRVLHEEGALRLVDAVGESFLSASPWPPTRAVLVGPAQRRTYSWAFFTHASAFGRHILRLLLGANP